MLAAFVGLVGIVFQQSRPRMLTRNSALAVGVVFGVTLSSFQTMGVYDSLALTWYDPLRGNFQAGKFLALRNMGL